MAKLIIVSLTLIFSYELCAYKIVEDMCGGGVTREVREATNSFNASTYSKKRRKMEEPIVFPEVRTASRSAFAPRALGKKCVGNLCSEVDDYPYDHVMNTISKIPDIDQLLGTEGGGVDLASKQPFGPDATTTNLCPVITHVQYPKRGTNTKNEEKFIVNVDGHQQGLIFEVCVENGKCMFSERFPNDYVAECTQKFAVKKLMALNEVGNAVFDQFEVPSCCVCTYRKNIN